MKPDLRRRLSESVEAAAGLAAGLVEVEFVGEGKSTPEPLLFSEQFACLNCGTSIPELEPRIFSFNSPHGACERCHGLGFQRVIDPELVVPDPTLSLAEGALQPWNRGVTAYWRRLIAAICRGARHRRRQALGETDEGRARGLPRGHRRGTPPGHLHQPLRPPALLQGPLRGDRQPPAAPLRGDRLRDQPRADRGLHGRAALPGVRRRAPAAGEPRGQGRRHQHRRLQRDVGPRRGRVDRVAGDERDRAGDRAVDRARDLRAARLPRERRHRLPLALALGALALRRRGAADPPCDADRLQPRRRHVRARRALDRPAPARQREADRNARPPPRPRQHGDRGRARRGDDDGRRPPGRPRPRRRRARRLRDRRGHARPGRQGPGLADRPVPLRQAQDRGSRGAARAGAAPCSCAAPANTT